MTEEEKCKNLYSAGNLWIRLFTSVRFWTSSYQAIEKYVPEKGKILDLGCGYGVFGNYIALISSKRFVIGVDTDTNKIENAYKGLNNTLFRVGDAAKMNLKDLDCILLLDVLHHLDSYNAQERLIKDCFGMLSKNGVLIISDVDNKPFWKLILARLTDFVMYNGQPVYYRFKINMLKILRLNFNNISAKSLVNNPFPHVLYICSKV